MVLQASQTCRGRLSPGGTLSATGAAQFEQKFTMVSIKKQVVIITANLWLPGWHRSSRGAPRSVTWLLDVIGAFKLFNSSTGSWDDQCFDILWRYDASFHSPPAGVKQCKLSVHH